MKKNVFGGRTLCAPTDANRGRGAQRAPIYIALVLAVACSQPKQKRVDEAVPVTVATVEQKDIPIQIRAIGNVLMLAALGVPVLAALARLRVRLTFEVVGSTP